MIIQRRRPPCWHRVRQFPHQNLGRDLETSKYLIVSIVDSKTAATGYWKKYTVSKRGKSCVLIFSKLFVISICSLTCGAFLLIGMSFLSCFAFAAVVWFVDWLWLSLDRDGIEEILFSVKVNAC